MKVIIPCAGLGTRRYPESKDVPKVLLDFQERPIIDWIIESVLSIDSYARFIFVLNIEHRHKIISHLKSYAGATRIDYCYQLEPLGFGHAVLQAKDLVGGSPVLVHACDKILDFDGFDMRGSWMAIEAIEPPLKRSTLKVAHGVVTQIIEKPNLSWNAVCYIRESNQLFYALERLVEYDRRTAGEFQMTDALQSLVHDGALIKAANFKTIYTESGGTN